MNFRCVERLLIGTITVTIIAGLSAAVQLLLVSCMYIFLFFYFFENSKSNLHAFHKDLTQSKHGAFPFDLKVKVRSAFVKKSFLEQTLLYVEAVDYRDREYNDAEVLPLKIVSTKQYNLSV